MILQNNNTDAALGNYVIVDKDGLALWDGESSRGYYTYRIETATGTMIAYYDNVLLGKK